MERQERPADAPVDISRAMLLLTAGTFALALNLNVLAPLLPDIGQSFGAGPATLGLLSAVYAVPQALGAPLLGPLADRWGRRPMLTLALVGFSFSALAAAFAPSLLLLGVSRAIAGISSSLYIPAAYAWIGDQVPVHRRAAGISNMTLASPLAALVILPVSGFLDVQLGWRSPFLLLGVLSLATVLPISRLPDSHRHLHGGPGLLGSYRELLSMPGAVPLLLASLCLAVTNFGPIAFLAVYLVEVHRLDVATAGIVLGVVAAARLIGNRLGNRFADRLGHNRAITWGTVGIALGYAALGLPGLPLVLAIAALMLVGIAFQAGYPAQVVMVTSLVPANRGGTAASANTGLFYLGATLGPLLTGLVVDASGAGGIAWVGLGGALAGLALILVRRRPGRFAENAIGQPTESGGS